MVLEIASPFIPLVAFTNAIYIFGSIDNALCDIESSFYVKVQKSYNNSSPLLSCIIATAGK